MSNNVLIIGVASKIRCIDRWMHVWQENKVYSEVFMIRLILGKTLKETQIKVNNTR